jgi:protein-S-isoprenylcysteine O-methyltransferase Ste14
MIENIKDGYIVVMVYPHFLLGAGWIIYCTLHSILADPGVKSWFRKVLGGNFKLYRLFYSLTAILLLIPLAIFQYRMKSPLLFIPGRMIAVTGSMIAAIGLAGAVMSLKKYIASPAGFKDLFFEGAKPTLQIHGMHRYVRHPLYLSTFLLIWGSFLYIPLLSIVMVNSIITAYTLLAIRFEENKLVSLYGDDYRLYQKKVPMILPKIRY